MKTQQDLYDKYLTDLDSLQKKCKHKYHSDWMWEQWAPGHSTGYKVKVCNVCSIVVARELNDNIIEGFAQLVKPDSNQ